MSLARIDAVLRDAAWLEPERLRVYSWMLAAMQLLGLLGLVLTSQGGLDLRGEPVGTDFVSFWSASRLALAGAPAAVYDQAKHLAMEQAAFGPKLDWYAFFYPPIFLLYCLPFGLAPYFVALGLWLGTTLAAYALTLRQFAAKSVGLLPILVFPAVFSTLGHGQNALLSAALFTGGALLLERRPVVAGLLLGALCFKPQLAAMIPFGLLLAGRWRALFAFGASALALAGLSLAVLGEAAWHGFFAASAIARATLEQGLVDPGKMQSVFTALRIWGAPLGLAYAAQAVMALAVAAGLIVTLRRTRDARLQMALIAVAALLATPFVLDYDFTLLAAPLLVLLGRGQADGFRPYEKTLLFAIYLLPAVARPLAMYLALPLSPWFLALFFAALARRALSET